MLRHQMPFARAGQVIGLLGGSFDPPHAAHVGISRAALRGFGLDRVWWLVSPGNPLKTRGPAPMTERIAAARALIDDPRIDVTGIEAGLGTRYTAETLRRLHRLYPGVNFVWLMGADNLAQLDQWQDWRDIVHSVPIGVLARPGARMPARTSKAARVFNWAKLKRREAQVLPLCDPPAWVFLNLPMSNLSSTAIRARGEWSGSDIEPPNSGE